MDNTASPIICKPIEQGAAVVVHSLTKYIGGHGADLWQIVFWRSIFCAMTIGIFLLITYKKKAIEKFKIAGFPGFIALMT